MVFTVLAIGASIGPTYIELNVIHAICCWCVASAVRAFLPGDRELDQVRAWGTRARRASAHGRRGAAIAACAAATRAIGRRNGEQLT